VITLVALGVAGAGALYVTSRSGKLLDAVLSEKVRVIALTAPVAMNHQVQPTSVVLKELRERDIPSDAFVVLGGRSLEAAMAGAEGKVAVRDLKADEILRYADLKLPSVAAPAPRPKEADPRLEEARRKEEERREKREQFQARVDKIQEDPGVVMLDQDTVEGLFARGGDLVSFIYVARSRSARSSAILVRDVIADGLPIASISDGGPASSQAWWVRMDHEQARRVRALMSQDKDRIAQARAAVQASFRAQQLGPEAQQPPRVSQEEVSAAMLLAEEQARAHSALRIVPSNATIDLQGASQRVCLGERCFEVGATSAATDPAPTMLAAPDAAPGASPGAAPATDAGLLPALAAPKN